MKTTFVSPDGTVSVSPQPTTVPLVFSANVWNPPAETACTLLSPTGALAAPPSWVPHATRVPSDLSATTCAEPLTIAVTLLRPAGTTQTRGIPLLPQALT